ncbi:hypothetical protein LWI28_006485 [Acer negundo]|uniref:Retrotransposon gag domain-containing protein n=1 Tax=Acer negundo TaxID=4023 RepID=A0AAD5ILJ6_ACENE|nr:hypothetical protein LWI28_006485 [Acer negundo]
MGSLQHKKSLSHLSSLKHGKNETIKEYLSRFNKKVVRIKDFNDIAAINAFTNGLHSGIFSFQLRRERPRSYPKLVEIAAEYTVEEEEEMVKNLVIKDGKGPIFFQMILGNLILDEIHEQKVQIRELLSARLIVLHGQTTLILEPRLRIGLEFSFTLSHGGPETDTTIAKRAKRPEKTFNYLFPVSEESTLESRSLFFNPKTFLDGSQSSDPQSCVGYALNKVTVPL